jgi:hypothetical protein
MKKSLFLLSLGVFFSTINSAQVVQDVCVELTATVQNSPPAITLMWPANNSNTTVVAIGVYRKFKAGTNFSSLIATLSPTATSFTDNNVLPGYHYEYKVARMNVGNYALAVGYINSGIEIPVVDNRGNLILMVDSTFNISLAAELQRLTDDLEGDGWNVIRHDVLRTGSPTHVKSIIVNDYANNVNTKALFLFGNIPVPYSGAQNPDGHGDHYGAWPADVYYGDVDGLWTDVSVNTGTNNWARINNVPGDGKFDQTYLPSDVDLQVGRVDLWGMTSFTSTEQQLLKAYLDKDHDYRKKNYTPLNMAVIDDNFGSYAGWPAQGGTKNFSPLVGTANVSYNDYFTSMSSGSYKWSYGCGGGTYQSAGGVGSTSNFAASNLDGVFTILFGSYFGDFDVQDNFLRAPLAQGKMLTCMWGGRPFDFFHHMAMGENIGYSGRVSQNNNTLYDGGWSGRGVYIALMGDPTLRNDVVAPVSNVIATRIGNNCNISWSASTQTNVIGYNIYMKNDSNKIYSRINNNLVSGLTFTDNCLLYPGIYKYMVRAVALENTPSGTYYNMSEGIADTALNNAYLGVNVGAVSNYTAGLTAISYSANGNNITSYAWDFGDGGTSALQNPVHTYTASGSFTVRVIASGNCDSDTAYLFNPIQFTSLKDLNENSSSVSLYPNPASEKITVSAQGWNSSNHVLTILNCEGKLIYESRNNSGTVEIDTRRFEKGLYLLRITGADNKSSLKKFVIE